MRIRTALPAALALTLVLALGACSTPTPSGTGGGSTGGGTTATGPIVIEKNYAFSPTSLNVNVGDTVSFVNRDNVAHHVVVGTTDLGIQQPGARVTWQAAGSGTVPFKCLIHPSMTGQFTVGSGGSSGGGSQPSSSTSPPAGTSGY